MKKIGEGARKRERMEGGREKELQTVEATLGEKDNTYPYRLCVGL